MSVLHLVRQGIAGRKFRSALVILFIAVLAAFLLATTLLSRGMEHSLRVGVERLGADIVVVPQGKEKEAQTALLTGKPVREAWMPAANLERIARVEGVDRVSPQLYLTTLYGAECCTSWEMFMVAFDPETDFTITPWLKGKLRQPLGPWDVIGGDYIVIPPTTGEIDLYGSRVNLAANLEPTALGMDKTMFLPIETARALARESSTKALIPLVIPPDQVSAVQVKVKRGYSINEVAKRVTGEVPGTYAFASLELTQLVRQQTGGLFRALFLGVGAVWVLVVLLASSMFFLMVEERRREIGVLRAVGASQGFIFRLFLTESALLGLGGGLLGISISSLFVYSFRFWLVRSTGAPLLFPSWPIVSGLLFLCLAGALVLASPALLYLALKASRLDPAAAMREE